MPTADPATADRTVRGLLDAIAARTPTPGGGAAAGLATSLAASIGHMSLTYSLRKGTAENDRADLERALGELSKILADMLDRCDADAAAYAEVNRLQRLSDDDPERTANWESAVKAAIDAPMAMMEGGCRVLAVLADCADRCSPWLVSDLGVSAVLAEASVRAAALNVNVNLPMLSDERHRDQQRHEMRRWLEGARQTLDRVQRVVQLEPLSATPAI